MSRIDGRENNQMRQVSISPANNPYAEGSCEVSFGNTKLLLTASVETDIPRWMEDENRGWITAEYGMLPRSTHTRMKREAASGKQGGRTMEIQRLIGRALRQSVALEEIAGLSIKLDCDVICADGGTRTAAISGAWVALSQAIDWAKGKGLISKSVSLCPIASVSVGVVNGETLLDLCYEEDSNADFDLNFVFNNKEELIEIQGTAEKQAISKNRLVEMFDLAYKGVEEIFSKQQSIPSQTSLHK